MNRYFTADTHFGSDRTRILSKRNFKSTDEMDQAFINNWNTLISKDDIVYHLGDFGEFKNVKKLNGNIVLILGNYEKNEMKEKFNNNFDDYKDYLKTYGFNEIYENNIELVIKGRILNLTHEPLDCVKDKFNLFGHIHKLQLVKSFGLNVGIDCHNYLPINEDEVEFYLNAIEKFYDKNVFCTESDIEKDNIPFLS